MKSNTIELEKQDCFPETRVIPSLQILAMKKLWQENPVSFEKTMAKMDHIFGDLDYVLKEEQKFKESIWYETTYGTTYGECIRKDLNHEIPNKIQVIFQYEDRLVKYLKKQVVKNDWIVYYDHKVTETHYDEIYEIRHVKIIARKRIDILDNVDLCSETKSIKKRQCDIGIIQRYHIVEQEIHALCVPEEAPFSLDNEFFIINDKLDIDINQLYYRRHSKELATKVQMNQTIVQLKKQILRGEFKVYCKTDCFLMDGYSVSSRGFIQDCYSRFDKNIKRQIEELKAQGLICINKPCSNPYCYFASEELYQDEMTKEKMS